MSRGASAEAELATLRYRRHLNGLSKRDIKIGSAMCG